MFRVKNYRNISDSFVRQLLRNYVENVIRFTHSREVNVNRSELWSQPAGYNTNIKIFNPILKEKVNLVLKNKNIASWYSCGPTVYDSAHIGHASCYVKFDIIRRILEKWFNVNVIMVMGITDVDDKIIKKANETKTDYQMISRKYEIEFFNDIRNLNILPPVLSARVTDYIPCIINFINKIIAEGYAYVTSSGSVYFTTSKFDRYNKFGLASLDENTMHNAIDFDDGKRSLLDFVLWKAAKPGEPFWNSPWGPGRPGWHIECSAIASAVFGCSIDLHSGGIDLKFPHHENEEAQSCTHYCVDQWVNYWMYSGHLHFKDGEKMSKSLNNTLSIEEFLEDYSANEFRIFCLMSHYRSAVDYSDDAMRAASGIFRKIESFIHTCDNYVKGQLNSGSINEEFLLKELIKTEEELRISFVDDFNTTRALSHIMDLISITNGMVYDKCENIVRNPSAVAAVSNFVKEAFGKLGLSLDLLQKESSNATSLMLSNVIDVSVDFRCKIRQIIQTKGKSHFEDVKEQKKRLYRSCDEYRDNMNNLGIELQDLGEKCSWKFRENDVAQSKFKSKR